MIKHSFVLIAIASIASISYGNINESAEQCDIQYGKPKTTQKDGDVVTRGYAKDGMDIYVTFRNGKAVHIQYGKQDNELSARETDQILQANYSGTWSKTKDADSFPSWRTPDGRIEAQYDKRHGAVKIDLLDPTANQNKPDDSKGGDATNVTPSATQANNSANYSTNSFEEIYEAAKKGDARAQFKLGTFYIKGEGVEKNMDEGISWYQKAANQGDARVQCILGIYYADGLGGIEKNPTKAINWLQKSADQGDADAQCRLGMCYTMGEGVEKKPNEAVNWYQKSANQGNASAQFLLGVCYSLGEGVEKNNSKADELLEAAKKNDDYYNKHKEQVDDAINTNNGATDKTQHFDPSNIKIKGFYIGMDIRSVPELLDKKLAGSDSVYETFFDPDEKSFIHILIYNKDIQSFLAGKNQRLPKESFSTRLYEVGRGAERLAEVLPGLNATGDGVFHASANGQVETIVLTSRLVNFLFNSYDMSIEDFLHSIVNAYHIPELKQSYLNGGPSWSYTSPVGDKITILEQKAIILNKVPNENERKASFD